MKKMLKLMLKIVLVIVVLVVLLGVFLLVKNYIDSQKPWLDDNYYTGFWSDSALEKNMRALEIMMYLFRGL